MMASTRRLKQHRPHAIHIIFDRDPIFNKKPSAFNKVPSCDFCVGIGKCGDQAKSTNAVQLLLGSVFIKTMLIL